ncbi:hypothetical protein C8J56DRAFT_207726 [Mycena floridula]|nr:hypothetical protein C8J56DRAFT_207726 [Mycena floridula]
MFVPFAILLFFVALPLERALVIDVADAAITYTPADTWNLGPQCPTCALKLDPGQTYNQTWCDCTARTGDTRPVQASVQFTGAPYIHEFPVMLTMLIEHVVGAQVSVHGILYPHYVATHLTFFIDSVQAGTYSSPVGAKAQPVIVYNVTFWTSGNLALGLHELVIQNGNPGGNQSLVLLDYIEYSTTVDSDSTSQTQAPAAVSSGLLHSTSTPTSLSGVGSSVPSAAVTTKGFATPIADTATVVQTLTLSGTSSTITLVPAPAHTSNAVSSKSLIGGLVGGLSALLILLILGIVVYRRRRQRSQRFSYLVASPFYMSPWKKDPSVQIALDTGNASLPSIRHELRPENTIVEENRLLRQALSRQWESSQMASVGELPEYGASGGLLVE